LIESADMRRFLATLFIVSCGSVTSFAADTTVKYYQEQMSTGGDAAKLMEVFIAGVGEGVFWANIFGDIQNKNARLYCPRGKLALNGHNYAAILDDEIKKQADRMTASSLLIMGLEETFPCKAEAKGR
jgi:hypothetical protein